MRFQRSVRFEGYQVTGRKVAAAARRLRLEREACPLFADLIAEAQPSVDELMAERAQSRVQGAVDRRARDAAWWRKGRARLYALPRDERAAFLVWWNASKMPATGVNLCDTLHCLAAGTFTPGIGFTYQRSVRP